VEENRLYEKVLEAVQKEMKDGIVSPCEGDSTSLKPLDAETTLEEDEMSVDPQPTLPQLSPLLPRPTAITPIAKRLRLTPQASTVEESDTMVKILECETKKVELFTEISESLRSIASSLQNAATPSFLTMLNSDS